MLLAGRIFIILPINSYGGRHKIYIFKFYKPISQFRKEHIPLIIKAYTRNDSYKNAKNNIF